MAANWETPVQGPSDSTRKASKRQTCLEALATSMGGDTHRVFWILKNFDESCILNPLANSSILKEWELLQVVTTFLLAGGTVTQYFSRVFCLSYKECNVKTTGQLFSGVVIICLLGVLLMTTMCRVFVLGRFTALQFNLINAKMHLEDNKMEAGYAKLGFTEQQLAKRYMGWALARPSAQRYSGRALARPRSTEDMLRGFAATIGWISIASKMVLLLTIFLWMVVIILPTHPRFHKPSGQAMAAPAPSPQAGGEKHPKWEFGIMLGLGSLVWLTFFGSLVRLMWGVRNLRSPTRMIKDEIQQILANQATKDLEAHGSGAQSEMGC